MNTKTIALLGLLTASIVADQALAVQNYVLCRSLTDNTVTAVFPGLSCPTGWSFVRPVQ